MTIPDSSLASDWNHLATQIRRDLLVSPEKTLADLERVRQRITKTGNTRVFVIGSQDSQKQLDANIQSLLANLEAKEFSPAVLFKVETNR